jgi:hypothetical protein
MDWLIFGIVIGLGTWGLVAWTRAHKIRVLWYEWAMAAAAVCFALMAWQNATASIAELEPQAVGFMIVSFGGPAILLAAAAAFLVWRRQAPAKAAATKA